MEKKCVFCNLPQSAFIMENKLAFAVLDNQPKSAGHTLIISKRHHVDISDLTVREVLSMVNLVLKRRHQLLSENPNIKGFNYRINEGAIAGQTVFHLHIHVIPRYDGDNLTPLGDIKTERHGPAH